MQEEDSVFRYVDILVRRQWLFVTPLILSIVIALTAAILLPPLYRSETTILVEPQRVPEDYVHSTVTGSVKDRLSVISQQILSRTKLENVIHENDLYASERQKTPMEELIKQMRKHIEVEVIEGSGVQRTRESSAAAFKLAFLHKDPAVAQKVAMKLASMYVEENLRLREDLARGATEFLDKQLEDMESELKRREEALRVFKETHMGELPEQLDANLRAMEQLQLQRGSIQEALRDAENRQVLLEEQLSEMSQYAAGERSDQGSLYRQLGEKRQALTELKSRYSDLYPDVIRLKDEIREIEARISGGGTEPTRVDDSRMGDPAYARLRIQVDENRVQVEGLRRETERLNAKMTQLQRRVEKAPKREQELISLARDYNTIKQSYNSLMERKISASIAENLEARQKSEQFHVLDPANFPEKPMKPQKLKILAFGMLLGLAMGGGLSLAAEHLDRSFRTLEEFKSAVALPVLGVIPRLVTEEETQRMKLKRRFVAVSCLLLFTASLVILLIFAGNADVFSTSKISF